MSNDNESLKSFSLFKAHEMADYAKVGIALLIMYAMKMFADASVNFGDPK